MKTKKKYIVPQIHFIALDNEISLVLESNPPLGPEETFNNVPDFNNNGVFKLNAG